MTFHKFIAGILTWPGVMGMFITLAACQQAQMDEKRVAIVEQPLLTVGHAAQEQATGQQRPKQVTDSFITTQVKTALFGDPQASGFQIAVNTYRGVVQISGFVDTAAQKQRAGELAGQTRGVRAVHNDLIVRSETNFTDAGEQASPNFNVIQSRKEGGS